MKHLCAASRIKKVLLGGSFVMCIALFGCSTGGTSKFGEGFRIMTGQGGTKEERDTIAEIVPNGSHTLLAADPVLLLHGASTKQLYFTALDPKSGQTLWE